MARSTSIRAKKTQVSTDDNHGNTSVTVISAPNTVEEEIRTRAYLLYEREGRQEGRDQEYWLRAESEILERYGIRR
jgi:hypothetical protein